VTQAFDKCNYLVFLVRISPYVNKCFSTWLFAHSLLGFGVWMIVFILISADSTEFFKPQEFNLSMSDKCDHLSILSWFLSVIFCILYWQKPQEIWVSY